jgi:Streptomycin adenylyltransferase
MQIGRWQPETIQSFVNFLEPNRAVKALILVGSNAKASIDSWSDVDLVCVIKDTELAQFFPGIEWLAAFGETFGLEQSSTPFKSVTRLCFDDFRRVDLVFIPENALALPETWNYASDETQVLFARSALVDSTLHSRSITMSVTPAFDSQQFERLAQQFWFKAATAIAKVMRNDLLIGLHLALDLARDCLVLGMIARDLEMGTTKHPHGGPYNELVDRIGIGNSRPTAQGILELILHAAVTFDALALRLSPTYNARIGVLRDWIALAQNILTSS